MNDSILRPHYHNTPGIDVCLAEIDREKWLVENMLLMPKHEAWLQREVRVRRAAGTTAIEGGAMDEAAVGRLLKSGPGGRLTEDEQANINAVSAYDFIDFLSDQTDIPIDELVIRQINRDFVSGSAETLTPGAYRKGENTVGHFTPPNQGDVPGLMRSFALWLRDDEGMHPVLKAGIAHIQLVALHPFWDGNGRTARGLATLVLQRSGFGFRKLLFLESHLFYIRDDYFTAIERTLGTSFKTECDATSWLEFFTMSVSSSAHQLTALLTEWHRIMGECHKDGSAAGLLTRQVDGYIFAVRTGQITRSDHVEIAGVSGGTASRDLARLVELGWLVPDGRTRSRIYRPARARSDSRHSSSDVQLPLASDSGP